MLDLRDVRPYAKIAFMSGVNCTTKVHQQKVIALHEFIILNDDDEPLPLIRCNRKLMPGRAMIFVDDVKLFNAALYVLHKRQLYVLSINVKKLFLKLQEGYYHDFYCRVFVNFYPPTLEHYYSKIFYHGKKKEANQESNQN